MSIGNDQKGAGMICRFAGVFVWSQLVTVHAAAVIRPFGVGAGLGAEAGGIALVYVLAGESVRAQLLSGGTQAQRSDGGLLAAVRTETVLSTTLEQTAALP